MIQVRAPIIGPISFMRGATAYEFQIGRLYGGWCHLYCGWWRHWWQLDRFHFFIESKEERL